MLPSVLSLLPLLGPNPKPGVVPTLREWTGGEGELALTASARICVPPDAPRAVARVAAILRDDLREVARLTPKVVADVPRAGDIVLTLKDQGEKLAAEGYVMEGSFDGRSWQRLAATDGGKGGTETVRFPTTEVRHVRLSIPAQKTATVSLFEIEVYR